MTHGSSEDRIRSKAKEAVGKLTGDRRGEAEGRVEQAGGEAGKQTSGGHDRTPPQVPPAG
ncbi:CsbD family protein [Streptomyces sp. NPDC002669]|uniref:CsbD family protein n=1 Tax=Streptomyces sp. NPDC002669 TaxID=3364658 RepID=UPI0036C14F7B